MQLNYSYILPSRNEITILQVDDQDSQLAFSIFDSLNKFIHVYKESRTYILVTL